jgi:hypothetical protein
MFQLALFYERINPASPVATRDSSNRIWPGGLVGKRGSNPGEREIFRTRSDRPLWAHPASYTTSTGSLLGVKRPGRGLDHPPPSTSEDKERVELYMYSLFWAFVACYRVTFTLLIVLNHTGF